MRFTGSVEKINEELQARIVAGKGVAPKDTPRLVVSGCPMAVPNWKLHGIVESSGAVIVGDETCVGDRGTQNLTDANGDTVDALIENLVDRYFKIDCAIFTPIPRDWSTSSRSRNAPEPTACCITGCSSARRTRWNPCPSKKSLEKAGVPTLRIDTDYSQEDVEQIRTRVEAFVERIKS